MSRREIIGDAILYLGDAREIIPPRLPDAVVTDIPYERSQPTYGLRKLDYGDWDGNGTSATALRVLRGLSCVPSLLAFCHWNQLNDIQRMFPDRMWRPIIWEKTNPTVANGEYLFLPFGEFAYYGKLPNAWFVGKCTKAVWRGSAPSARDHPTQKPLALMEWIVSCIVAPSTTCFDPFMGSGTTGIACLRTGRKFIGVEKEIAYFDVACRRMEAVQRQPMLLDLPIVMKTENRQDDMFEP